MFSTARSKPSDPTEAAAKATSAAHTLSIQLTSGTSPSQKKFSDETLSTLLQHPDERKNPAPAPSAAPLPSAAPPLERKKSGGKFSIQRDLNDPKGLSLTSPKKAHSSHSVVSPTASSSRAVFVGLGQNPDKKEEKKPSTAPIPKLGTPLPLLELAKKYVPLPCDGGPNFDFDLLTSQHLMENTLPGLDFGFERGLQPRKTICVGKIYSNHHETEAKLKAAGVNVVSCPKWKTLYGFEQSFESGCIEACKKFLNSLKPGSRPVIMDDGGRLAKIIAGCNLTDHPILKEAVFIEQTTSGGPALDGFDSPIINLYGAVVKTAGEAPLVAASTVENLKIEIENLRRIDPEYKEFKKSSIAVIGVSIIVMA